MNDEQDPAVTLPLTNEYFISIQDPSFIVTAVWARARPCSTDLAPIVIDEAARMFPTKMLEIPMVAADPTDHHTFFSWPLLVKIMTDLSPVITVVVVLNIQTESALFAPFSVTLLLTVVDIVPEQYMPATNTMEEMSAAPSVVVQVPLDAETEAEFESVAH